MKVLVVQSCLILGDPMDCSQPSSSVHEIIQARILEWVAISFPRGSSRLRDRTCVSLLPADSLLLEPPGNPIYNWNRNEISASKINLPTSEVSSSELTHNFSWGKASQMGPVHLRHLRTLGGGSRDGVSSNAPSRAVLLYQRGPCPLSTHRRELGRLTHSQSLTNLISLLSRLVEHVFIVAVPHRPTGEF